MIPPVIDPAPRTQLSGQSANAREGEGEASLRFADLLEGVAKGAAASTVEDRPAGEPVADQTSDAHARLFNQDGFFGHTSLMLPVADSTAATTVMPPIVSTAPVAGTAVSTAEPLGGSIRHRDGIRPLDTSPPPSPPLAPRRAAITGFDRAAPHPLPAATTPRLPKTEPVSLPSRTAPARRPPPQPIATVAVALHALARGIEVAAQVAGLDEHDRAALTDEIAALLSSHGYAPARVSVTAMPPRQEHR